MENTSKSNIIARSMVIMILLCQLIRCKIQANVSLYPFTTTALVWDVAGTHMVVVNQANASIEYYDFSLSQFIRINWTTTGMDKILTFFNNTPSNYVFLLFGTNTIYGSVKGIPLLSNYSIPYNLTNVMTRGLGNYYTQIYGTDVAGNYTKFIWSRLGTSYTTNYNSINFMANYQLYYNNSVFYALNNSTSTSNLVIYSTSLPGQPAFINLSRFSYANCPKMTIDAYNSYLVVNCGNFVEIRNANSPNLSIINITLANYSDQVVILNYNSFIAKSNNQIYQYSILNGQIMDSQRYNISFPNKMRRVGPNSVYLFTNQSAGVLYNFSDTFLCQSNCTYGTQYVIVNSTYITITPSINTTNTTTLNSTNTTVNSTNTTVNSTDNTTSNTNATNTLNTSNFINSTNLINSTVMNGTNATINATNNTTNTTTMNTTNITNITNITNTSINTVNNTSLANITSTQSPSFSNQMYSQKLRTASVALGNSLSILSIRFIMKSNIPVTLFLEQFYLYKYYAGVQYPQFMAIFMQEIQIKPDFMSFMESNYSIERSFFYSNVYTNDFNTYSPLYFTQSIKQFFIATIPLNLGIFIVFKIVAILLSKLRLVISFEFVKMLHESFDSQSRLWILFLTIMEADFLANSFYCLNQISMTYSYSLQNKTNFIGSLILFYIIFIYGLVGYPIMNRCCKKFSHQLLIFSKQQRQSFWLQNSIILSLKLIKSFGHSIIFSNPEYRFGFLVAADCAILIYIFKIRKLFYNNIHLFLYLAYQLGVLFVNSLLLLRQNLLLQNSEQLGYIIQYTMIILFSLTILKFLISLYRAAYQLFQLLFSRNKVAPNSILSKKKDKDQQEKKKEDNQKKNRQVTEKKTKKILCKKSKDHIEASKKQSVIEQIQQMNKNGVNTIFRYNNKKYKQNGQKSKNNNNIKQKKIHMVERFKTQRNKGNVQGKFPPFGNDFSLH